MADRVLTVALSPGPGGTLGVVLESHAVDQALAAYEREQRFLSGQPARFTPGRHDLYCWDGRYLRAPRWLAVNDLIALALVRTRRKSWTSRSATVDELRLNVLALGYLLDVSTGMLTQAIAAQLIQVYIPASKDPAGTGSWALTKTGLRRAANIYSRSEPADDDEVPI